MTIYEPLTVEQEAALRESIERDGVRDAVLISSLSGRILSGTNRARIADELGVVYARTIVTCADEIDELRIEIEENPQRRLLVGERDGVITQLRAAGWSDRRIAAQLGVHWETVRRSGVAFATPEVLSSRGKRQPSSKATAGERAQREQLVADLYRQGYGRNQIAEALHISNGSVDVDLRATSTPLRGRGVRTPHGSEVPPTIEWRTAPKRVKLPPLPEPTAPRQSAPTHRLESGTFARIRHTREWFDEKRWALGVCAEVDSAVELGDREWLDEYVAVITSLRDDFGRLLRIANDPAYRLAQSRMSDGTAPTSTTERLRAVQ